MAITHEQISAALFNHIDTNLTVVTTIWWPGSTVDIRAADDWIDVRVASGSRIKQRKTNLEIREITLRTRIFAKLITNLYRAFDIQMDLASILTHGDIQMRDYTLTAQPNTGLLRLNEPRTIDVTRGFNEPIPNATRAIAMEYAGTAHEN